MFLIFQLSCFAIATSNLLCDLYSLVLLYFALDEDFAIFIMQPFYFLVEEFKSNKNHKIFVDEFIEPWLLGLGLLMYHYLLFLRVCI